MVVPPDSPHCRAAAQAAVHPVGDERIGAATPAISPLAHDIAKAFELEFEVVVADTPELRAATFALRHQVYCQEYGFEPIRADGLERDAYDDRARHYLLAHVPSKGWAGCVRVVYADSTTPELGLPFETAQTPLLDDAGLDLAAVPRSSLGEVSRLMVAAEFRRRVRDLAGPRASQPDDGSAQLRFQPPAVLAIALIALAAAAEGGLSSLLCMMEPRFEEQLRTHGIRFAQVSKVVDHHGRRALFHMAPQTACLEVQPELQGILAAIRSRISASQATGVARRKLAG